MAHYANLILGCGYLGRHLLPGLPTDSALAVTLSTARHAELTAMGAMPLACDLGSGALPPATVLRNFHGVVHVLLPPSAFAAPDAAGAVSAIVRQLEQCDVVRGVLASSTAVYGECHGEVVTAQSPATGAGPRAERLLAIEQAWLGAAFATRVLRFAGLYGPGRVIGRNSILHGEVLPGTGMEWLNLVRIEDAAQAMLAAARTTDTERIGLVADGTPVRRADYYGHLARLLGKPPPQFAGAASRDGGSRRCDPASTWAVLACRPRYADYRAGLADLI